MTTESRSFVLPVDIPRKSELVQNRIGFIIVTVIVALMVFLLFLLSVNVGLILAKGAAALPDIRVLENWRPNESTRIFDRNGNLIANIHGDEDRVVVPLKDISPNIQRAVMAIEDNRFYRHGGVDFRGTLRALVQNAGGGDVQGGSTLTQQLVKNLFLTPERSVTRKLAEALLAMRVEKYYDKNRILELYLNQVSWGNQAYGIEKAARRYFRKPAKELTIPEAALLAGLLKAPEGLSPFLNQDISKTRTREVINSMEKYGYITQAQEVQAETEVDQVYAQLKDAQKTRPSKHPFFVTYVIQELMDEFGEDVVRRGGLKVYTTIDDAVQTAAEDAVHKGVERDQFNKATQARRAVGSTFKPFVYLTAFRLGLITPESPIVDRPVAYGNWAPHNWDGKFMGPMTVRKALTLSRNTTTVQVGMKIGMEEIIKTARLAGIESPIDNSPPSMLGSSGVSPLEMANAYSTFARGGIRLKPTGILRLEDSYGREIMLEDRKPERVFEIEPLSQLVSILIDVVEMGTGKNARLPGRQIAGKTGTTDHVADIWFAGFTPDMTTVVWMGNGKKPVPLNGVFSSNSAQVWHDYADAYYKLHPVVPTTFPILLDEHGMPKRMKGKFTGGWGGGTPSAAKPAPKTAPQAQIEEDPALRKPASKPDETPAPRAPEAPTAPAADPHLYMPQAPQGNNGSGAGNEGGAPRRRPGSEPVML
jgi:penicillin-binding protein 1A